jgi:hypothetical protein
VSVPDFVRRQIRQQLWSLADELGWMNLATSEKKRLYEDWTRDMRFGGTLSRYIDRGQVRVYLKDTIMKEYTRAASADPIRPLRMLKLSSEIPIAQIYIKPHGRRLADGRIVSWGRACDWKLVLMALHERAHNQHAIPFAAILTNATGRFGESSVRRMIEDAAMKLKIQTLLWA